MAKHALLFNFYLQFSFQIYAMMNCSMNSSQTARSRLLLFKISLNQFFTGTSQTSLEKIPSIQSTSPPRLELARCFKVCFPNLFLRLISFILEFLEIFVKQLNNLRMSAPDVPDQHHRRPHQLSESSAIEQHMVI